MHPVVNCTGAWLLTSTRCTLLAVSLCMVLCMALGMVLGVWVALFAHHCVVISEGSSIRDPSMRDSSMGDSSLWVHCALTEIRHCCLLLTYPDLLCS
jgi:hypothetical protein